MYSYLRQAPLSDEIKTEFGVSEAWELVDMLNTLWAGERRQPLPQGQYPSSSGNLRYVVRELRIAIHRQRHSPSSDRHRASMD